MRDSLTGVYSRATLNARLQEEVYRAQRYRQSFSLILLDLDYFKSINDAFGHLRGNQTLTEFARRLTEQMRSADLIFRFGGDEFIILLPHTSKTDAMVIAQRLLGEFQERNFPGEPPLTLTFSAGVAAFPVDAQTPETLFEIADRRHYQAKRSGRGRVVGDDFLPNTSLLVDEPPRLIERERELETLYNFLEALPENRRGLLAVRGAVSSGKSRFLSEARKIARLRGFAILNLRGAAVFRLRQFGCLDNARQEWGNLPPPSQGEKSFIQALKQSIASKGHTGLLIMIDNVHEVDTATMDFIRLLFGWVDLATVGVIFSIENDARPPELAADVPLVKTVTLEPISIAGLRIWVRHSLQWEAPDEFIEWLHGETAGLPELIQSGLNFVVEKQIVYSTPEGRACRPDFERVSLAKAIARRSGMPPHNLPAQLPSLVGREEEIQQLKHLLQQKRLVTLLGAGGLGKTRLALQVALELLLDFPGGVSFVPAAALYSADFLPYAIAEALRLTLAGPQDPRRQLLDYLRARENLLILDGFEHVREGVAFLAEMQERATGLKLLVISEERLGLTDESVFELNGLPYPTPLQAEELKPEEFGNYAAVRLFVESAQRVRSDFTIQDEDLPYVARICRLVEGMPLGVELAAAWVQSYSCQQIAENIEQNLAFLDAYQQGMAGSRRSLYAVFDSFWQLLSAAEQNSLCRLSVFLGGFREDAARQVAEASPFFLDALVTRSFLRKSPQGRLELQEPLRHYAVEKLRALPAEYTLARQKHCDYYTLFLKRCENDLGHSKRAPKEITADYENIRQAWRWAIDRCQVSALGRGARSLGAYFRLTSLFREGENAFADAIACIQSQEHTGGSESQQILPCLYTELAGFHNSLAKYREAIAAAQNAIQLGETVGDTYSEAVSYQILGMAHWYLGEYQPAQQFLTRALHLARELKNPDIETNTLRNLGAVAARLGNNVESKTFFEQSLALSRTLGDRASESASLNNLGNVYVNLGDYATARSYFEQAYHILHEIGNQWGESLALNNLGSIADSLGEYSQAIQYFEQSLKIKRDIGERRGEGLALSNLAFLSHRLGLYENANAYYEQSLMLSHEIGDQWGEGRTLAYLSLLQCNIGNYPYARELASRALEITRQIGEHIAEGFALTHLGCALFGLQKWEEAGEHYRAALTLRRDLGQHNLAMEPLAGLVQLAQAQGDIRSAMEHAELILAYLDQGSLDGTLEPMSIYLSCYHALRAGGDARAPVVLEQARKNLVVRADRILDETQRRSYLENVSSHREIMKNEELA